MDFSRHASRHAALAVFVLTALFIAPPSSMAAEPADTAAQWAADAPEPIKSEVCLGCHGLEGFSVPRGDGTFRPVHVSVEKFKNSVHGGRECTECHKDIKDIPHSNIGKTQVGCVKCHQDLWAKAVKENKTAPNAKLGNVVQAIGHFMKSVHARPSMTDQSRTNATCYDCHDAHYVYPKGSGGRNEWRRTLPNACGKCHAKEKEGYLTSVHAKEALEKADPDAPVCSDCHNSHDVETTKLDATRLVITQNCGNCHKEALKTYIQTYHGQVNRLGFAYTAKCFDCHGNHAIQRVDDKHSSVHPDNRLKTCQQCHKQATAGFISFQPHGDPDDYTRYPLLWIVKKAMIGLLVGVFAFFWVHVALWFYRESKERQERKNRPHVLTESLLPEGKHYVRRFAIGWRIAHLTLILAVMTLVLTGMSALFAHSNWAPVIVKELGSPRVAATMHRVAASMFIIVFLGHLFYVLSRIAANWTEFKFFGPTSMVPNWQDLKDIVAMFKWFFGKAPRPAYERWTYWEKFDYWAVFWGIGVIGISGLMLWSPTVTASFLPGWVFNVATIFHGEEAILAAVFLFTVHFFNNHFRPEKFPLDTVMFTGAVPLEEFKREHAREFNRLVKTGELEKYLVDAPSRPMTIGSRILGFTLLSIGLTLLVLVFAGLLRGGH